MQGTTLVTFIFFTGLVGLITWIMTRKDDHGTSTGYFLAGRTLTAGFIAGSLMLTNLSTEQLVGLNGAAFSNGLCVFAWEVIAAMALVCMGLYFLPKFLKSGVATVPQFLEKRFDHNTRTITTVIFIVAYAAILLPIILYTGATGLAGMLDISSITGIADQRTNIWIMVWLIGVIGSIYAIFGGLRTVAISDTLNGFGLIVGGVMIVLFGLHALGGEAGGILKGLEVLRTEHTDKLNSIARPDQAVPFGTLFTGVLLLNLFYWCTNQQIIQRTLGASSLKEGQKGVLLAGFLKVLAPLILVIPGIIAFHLYKQQILMPLDDAGNLKADLAYGKLVRHVLPSYLTGFFAAVIIGAILSSFNSALNSTATLFSLGLYKGVFRKNAGDGQTVKSGKLFGCVVAVAAMCIAPLLYGQESIFGYLQKMNAIYFIPIFAVVVMGLIHKRTSALAANIGLVFAFATIILVYFTPGLKNIINTKSSSFLLHEFHFIGAVFVATLALIAIVSMVKPRSEAWRHEHSGDVDMTPWKHAKWVGALLVAIVLGLYAYFADFSVLK
ncbi:MAG: solute:sodium symporter family transporter [Phycisphaerae bacterium]|jgi:SSS family solute:Na+ symporter|nr:solute:sodium symporter family transporter [Phycisphaerae bacterium]